MNINLTLKHIIQTSAGWVRLVVFATATLLSQAVSAIDFCGCEGHPDSLGTFDMRDETTWPPGTFKSGQVLLVEVPEDGVMIFDNIIFADAFPLATQLRFLQTETSNPHNKPITLLVAGDVDFVCHDGCFFSLNLNGTGGSTGSSGLNGLGGAPGPGGFRGGDGAYQAVIGAGNGGAGLGPGGGAAGNAEALTNGGNGVYTGNIEQRPQIGGSGGGGGASNSTDVNCSAGGGGGGAGAITIVANGAIRFNATAGTGIQADGGNRGARVFNHCARDGGHGSGGAIRLVAETISGSGYLFARAPSGRTVSTDGKIRLEAINNSLSTLNISPVAVRSPVIGPVANPFASSVAITAIDGLPVPDVLTGSTGRIDLVVSMPGDITLQLESKGVPSGTTLEVSVKPKTGGSVLIDSVVLDPASCNNAGECTVFITFDLTSNVYFAEAKATFQVP